MKAQFTPTSQAELIRSDQVAPFGGGYRQVVGPTVSKGTVGELLEQVRLMSSSDVKKMFFKIEGVNNILTVEEVSNSLSAT